MLKTLHLSEHHTPASLYPRERYGKAEIKTHFWKRGSSYGSYGTSPPGSDDKISFIHVDKRLPITELSIDGKTWMVDDPPHWWFIQKTALDYHGHVLVAGLGLGLIVHALSQNPKVTKITVVERDPDVIELIRKHVPKCRIVCADWYKYKTQAKVDGVFFDLFVGNGHSLIPAAIREMISLRERFPNVVHRILGFNNETLNQLVDLLVSAKAPKVVAS